MLHRQLGQLPGAKRARDRRGGGALIAAASIRLAAGLGALVAAAASARAAPADDLVRLATLEPGHGTFDRAALAAVGALIGDARLVSVGEATHGTHEFELIEQRVVELLVANHGFSAVAFELSLPEAFDLDAWVQGGPGDPVELLGGTYYWHSATEEKVDLLRWLRRWNQDAQHRRKVHVYGFDMMYPPRALRAAVAPLRAVEPTLAETLARELEPVGSLLAMRSIPLLSAERRTELASRARALVAALDRLRAACRARSSEGSWSLAREHAAIVSQYLEVVASGAERDLAMADNVDWILAREGPRGRVALIAHDAHVALSASGVPAPMGGALRARHGRDYVSLGTLFGEGEFRAMEIGRAVEGTRVFSVGPDELAPVLAGARIAFVDLRTAGPWWHQRRKTRFIGASYAEAQAPSYLLDLTPAALWDGVFLVARTTAAQALPGLFPRPPVVLTAPRNLDFETSGDRPLPGWLIPDGAAAAAWRATATHRAPHGGSSAGVIERRSGHSAGELPGMLRQVVDAAPFRGQRVRLGAWVRAAGGARVTVWLTAALAINSAGRWRPLEPATGLATTALASDLRPEIADGTWRHCERIVDVPAAAAVLDFGLGVDGAGSADVDDVELAVVN